ncbi:MAG: DUF4912 domain-containing protein [Nitrospirota bacterium]
MTKSRIFELSKKPQAGKTKKFLKKKKLKEASLEPETLRKLISERGELPESYGETRLVLIPIEPYLAHVYWEISPQDMKKTRIQLALKFEGSEPVLRFYDVTDTISDISKFHSFFDVGVQSNSGNWYVHLWSPGRSYFAELGLRIKGGHFFSFSRSNFAILPADRPSTVIDEGYMIVTEDYKLVEVSPVMTARHPSIYGISISTTVAHAEPVTLKIQTRKIPEGIPENMLVERSEENFISGISS